MYKCELPDYDPEITCKQGPIQLAGTRATKVPIRVRATEYPSRPKANKLRVGRKMKTFDDPGGAGYEIAKEVLACPQCARDWEALRAKRQAAGDFGDVEEPAGPLAALASMSADASPDADA
ncbi:MAG: hypothetical protein AAF411_17975 [Myxococcota bacterium]